MWNMQRWHHQNPNLLQLSISGQLWQPSISGHGYTGWHKENCYLVAMTGLTSRQPWYEHHWYSGDLTGERCLSICPSVGSSLHQPLMLYTIPHTCPSSLIIKPLILLLTCPVSSICCLSCFSCLSSIVVPPKKSAWERTSPLPLQPLFSISPHSTITHSTQSQRFQSLVSWFSLACFSLSLSCLHSHSPRGAGSKGWRFTLIAAWLQASPGQSSCGASVCWM